MAEKIKIIVDSCVDLPAEIVEKYNLDIVRMTVTLGEKSGYDGTEIVPDDIYAYVDKTGQLAKTAAVSVSDWSDAISTRINEGYSVICITLSSELSATNSNARIACEEFENAYVVDSRNLSTGIAHVAIEAAELAVQGTMTAKEIADHCTELTSRVDVSFVLDTLLYLWKGGRCSGVAALGANILRLKPCIEVSNGSMGVGKKYRGNLVDCMCKYVDDRLAGRDDIDTRRIFITYSGGLSDDDLARVKERVMANHKFENVYITHAGSTISCHCGPRCLGILYIHTK